MRSTLLRARLIVLGVVFGVLALLGGCSQTAKVEGVVKYKGEPVTGATVQFVLPDGNIVATGISDTTGKYKMVTPQGKDAIPAGSYIVQVTKTDAGAMGALGKVDFAEGAKGDYVKMMMSGSSKKGGTPKNTLPIKYASKESPLKITVPGSYDLELAD